MKTYESFLTLIAELDGDAAKIGRVLAHNCRAWDRIQGGANDPIDWGALAYTIHTLYGIAENYFLRVSKFFENNLPSDRRHRSLVEKMALDIPGLRPALLREPEDKRDAMDILKFRHRFRNLYGEDLDPMKTTEIQKQASRFISDFSSLHGIFRENLVAIAEALR